MDCNTTVSNFSITVHNGTLDALGGYLVTMVILGIVGNTSVIACWITRKKLRTPSNAFLVNLAVSDVTMLATSAVVSITALFMHCWPFQDTLCQFAGFISFLTGLTSMNTHCFIAASRYELIVRKRTTLEICKPIRVIPAIWLFALFWAVCPLVGWSSYTLEARKLACSIQWNSPSAANKSYIISVFIFDFVIPFGAMISFYLLIMYEVRKSRRAIHSSKEAGLRPEDIRLVNMTLIMALTYMICWCPYAVVSFLKSFHAVREIHPLATLLPGIFAKSSAVGNFIIYILTNRTMRRNLLHMYGIRFFDKHTRGDNSSTYNSYSNNNMNNSSLTVASAMAVEIRRDPTAGTHGTVTTSHV